MKNAALLLGVFAIMLSGCASVDEPIEFGTEQCENIIIMPPVMAAHYGGTIAAGPIYKKQAEAISGQVSDYEKKFAPRLAKLYEFYWKKIQNSNFIIIPLEEDLTARDMENEEKRSARVAELFAEHNAQMLIIPYVKRQTTVALGFEGVYGKSDITLATHVYYAGGHTLIGPFTTDRKNIMPKDFEMWRSSLNDVTQHVSTTLANFIFIYPKTTAPELLRDNLLIYSVEITAENKKAAAEEAKVHKEYQRQKVLELQAEANAYWETLEKTN